jgi:hypothetical protein
MCASFVHKNLPESAIVCLAVVVLMLTCVEVVVVVNLFEVVRVVVVAVVVDVV